MRMCFGRRLLCCAAHSFRWDCGWELCAVFRGPRPGRFALVRHKRPAGGIYWEMNLARELQAHFEWLRLSSSSMVESTSCAWRLTNRKFHQGTAGLDINLLPPGRARGVFLRG